MAVIHVLRDSWFVFVAGHKADRHEADTNAEITPEAVRLGSWSCLPVINESSTEYFVYGRIHAYACISVYFIMSVMYLCIMYIYMYIYIYLYHKPRDYTIRIGFNIGYKKKRMGYFA